MRFNKTTTIVTMILACAALLFLGGCGSKKAATPKDACKNMARSLEKNDKPLFVANVWMGDDAAAKEKVGKLFDTLAAVNGFFLDYEKAYGKDENMKDASIKESEVDGFTFKEEGDKATATDKSGKPVKCIKKDGGWLVDLSEEFKDENALKMMEGMAKVFGEMRPEIGKCSKEEFQKKMGEKMMGGAAPMPPADMQQPPAATPGQEPAPGTAPVPTQQ